MSYSDEDRAHEERIARWNESKTKSAELLAECDRVLAELRAERQAIDNDPIAWSNRLLAERHAANVIPLPRKPSPEPEPPARLDIPLQVLIQQAAGDLRAALIAQREEIMGWARKKLRKQREEIEAVLDGASRLDEQVISLQGDVGDIRRKTIEGDLVELRDDVSTMKADIAALTRSVEGLTSELAQLRDTVDTIERANKVINLRGAS